MGIAETRPHLPGLPLRFFEAGALGFSSLALFDAARSLHTPCLSVGELFLRVPGSPRASELVLVTLAGALAGSAFLPARGTGETGFRARALPALRSVALVAVLLHAAIALANAVSFFRGIRAGVFSSSWPVPSSLVLAAYLLAHAWCVHRAGLAVTSSKPVSRVSPVTLVSLRTRIGALLWFGVFCVAAAMFHLHAFGLTDYRRPADAILVLGAKVYDDGRPSEALAERVDTAIELYKRGLSSRLIMSGGTGPNGRSEPDAMRQRALDAGVPDDAILLDQHGDNTRKSVDNTAALFREKGFTRVLAVSHYHHLTRIKLLATQAHLPCYTVPADEGEQLLRGTPYYVLRETAAVAYYYLAG